jgi:hypothetical protein
MTMSQEALLWKTAFGYLGPSNLYKTVVDLWRQAGVPARPTVEYLGLAPTRPDTNSPLN